LFFSDSAVVFASEIGGGFSLHNQGAKFAGL
jgi:hypothetical protein